MKGKKNSARFDGITLNGWDLGRRIGSGGNGDVYSAKKGIRTAAVKILRADRWQGKSLARFRDEIEAMQRYLGNPRVLPVFDFNIPQNPSENEPPWFAMGLAETVIKALGSRATLKEIIDACSEFAEVIAEIHDTGDAHRDIKPDNLFRFQDNWAIGDFGLVQHDGKSSKTARGERIGPLYYLAPEMLNNALYQCGIAADVFSFAKTVWVLCTGQRFPYPGQMQRNIAALRLSSYVSDANARSLDPLIEAATSFTPSDRPTMSELAAELRAWLRPPHPLTGQASEIDLSEFVREITAINQDHYINEQRIRAEHTFIASSQDQILEPFRLLTEELSTAIETAGFLNPRKSYNGIFVIQGHILATAWSGEVTLRYEVWATVQPNGKSSLTCQYIANVAEDGRTTDWSLWESTRTFLVNGNEESEIIASMLLDSRVQLKPSVARVLSMSKGDEGAPPRSK